MKVAIIVHGGAGNIPVDEHPAYKNGCRIAVLAGYEILSKGGSALDAIETAVTILEDDPAFDAGTGSHLNQAGRVQLDAGCMDGATLQIGAIAAVETIKNPVQLVRRLLKEPHNMFVGQGAIDRAKQYGIPFVEPESLIVEREQKLYEQYLKKAPEWNTSRPGGTVGAVAIDRAGNLAVATSTGGTLFKPVGRVGDSPLPGCGYYADNQSAAVSSTGHGESITRVQLARLAADLAAQSANQAPSQGLFSAPAQAAIRVLEERVKGRAGLIMINRTGHVGFAHNTPYLARAFLTEDMTEPEVGI